MEPLIIWTPQLQVLHEDFTVRVLFRNRLYSPRWESPTGGVAVYPVSCCNVLAPL